MGPEPFSKSSSTPHRPRFSWDLKSVPWTDGKGPQDEYSESVAEWCNFHDILQEDNTNKLGKKLRGSILKSQCYGQAKDLAKSIPLEKLNSENGAQYVVNAIHKRDPLSVVSEVFTNFNALISTRRRTSESIKDFESRFSAQLSRFKAYGTGGIPESLLALMLLSNADVDDSQRVSILAACVTSVDEKDDATPTKTAELMKKVKYEAIASVLRQCDRSKGIYQAKNEEYLSGNQASTANNESSYQKNNRFRRINRTPAETANMKARFPCHQCNKYGHWANEHNSDGTLRQGVKSHDTPVATNNEKISPDQNEANGNSRNKQVMIGFNSRFEMVNDTIICNTAMANRSDYQIGPLVDDGAAYSAIGEIELELLKKRNPSECYKMNPKPIELNQYKYWQYGAGNHSSEKRIIRGSVILYARTDNSNIISICHLVVEGSSQWLIGRNLTRRCNIEYIGTNSIRLPNCCPTDRIQMCEYGHHSHIDIRRFTIDKMSNDQNSPSTVALAATSVMSSASVSVETMDWPEIRRIVDRVHSHTCGHATFSDIRTLLVRNRIWNENVQSYLAKLVMECTSCKSTSTPPPNRRVSLASLNRGFNDVVCIDHFFLESVTIFHMMDVASRFSTGVVVDSTSMEACIYAVELGWFAQFWPPSAVHADGAFKNEIFGQFLENYGIEFRPVPPRRHQKNMIEPKHGSIRSIFLRLKAADEHVSDAILAIKAIRISNDLYGSDTLSAFEMAKGYSKPLVANQRPIPVDELLQSAHDELIAKRKLTLILRSNTYKENSFKPGDMIQVFIKDGKNKRGKWMSPRQILEIDYEAGTVTVPGRSGKVVCAAVEDARAARHDNELSTAIQESIDELDFNLVECLNDQPTVENEDNTQTEPPGDFNMEGSANMTPTVGSRISVYWPLDNQYYPGTINSINNDGEHVIQYDDDDTETLKLSSEQWKYVENDAITSSQSGFKTILGSNEQDVLNQMFESLGNKSFMRHQAQAFDQAPLVNSYNDEESKFTQNVKTISRSDVPKSSNIIGSHTIYKIKLNDNHSFKLKARIAPHGNEDSDKDNLRTDCCMCPPIGIRVIVSTATMRKLRIVRIDAKGAFLQTGPAQRDVYVIPPYESKYRNVLWLLETAAYGLINSNAKWQHQSDALFVELGLQQVELIPQLFALFSKNGDVLMLAVKIVDDILLTGIDTEMRNFITKFNDKFELGEVVHGPGNLRYYGMNLVQYDDYTVSIHADDKIQSIEPYPISRIRRRQCDEKMNEIEMKSFMSINASIGWLGITASPLCSFYSSYLQQKMGECRVSAITAQFNALKLLKRYGTQSKYIRPKTTVDDITLVAFADASHTKEASQLCYIVGLMIGNVVKGNPFHLLSWASHRSRRPAKSTPAAEILAASEAVDEIVMIKKALSKLINIKIRTMVIVDSKDLYYALSSKKNTIDKSVRPDVNSMRFYFETVVDVFAWIAGSLNPADVGTKLDSPLTETLILTLATGILQIDLSECEMSRRDKSFG